MVRHSFVHKSSFTVGHRYAHCVLPSKLVYLAKSTLLRRHADLLCPMNCPKNRTTWRKRSSVRNVYRIRPALTMRCGDYFHFFHMLLIVETTVVKLNSNNGALKLDAVAQQDTSDRSPFRRRRAILQRRLRMPRVIHCDGIGIYPAKIVHCKQ